MLWRSGLRPRPHYGGAHDTPPDLLLRGGEKGGQGPGHGLKKLKLSCRITHIDALAVAVINDHKTAHINIAALHHFRHITRQKVFSFRGLCSLTP